MQRRRMRAAAVASLLAMHAGAVPAADALQYRLSYPGPASPRVELRIDLPEPLAAPQVLVMPRAVPLGYGEQPYDEFVTGVRAFSPANEPLAVERLEGPRWQLGNAGQLLGAVRYDVDLKRMETSIAEAADSSRVRAGYVGILGYSVFAYLDGQQDRSVGLSIAAPEDWARFSTLAPEVPPPSSGPLAVRAADFHALADSQIALGPSLVLRSVPARAPLYLVSFAEVRVDTELIGQLGQQALHALIDYLGPAPFEHYTLHVEFLRPLSRGHRYDRGMEHLDSASFSFTDDRGSMLGSQPEAVRYLLFAFAHRIAQAWIPARCAGQGYRPFPWELAPVLDTVWFDEGFPQYVALLALGSTSGQALETLVGDRFGDVLDAAPPVIRRMSTLELSRVASTRCSSDVRTGRSSFARGGMMAAEMDALIRSRTGGGKSLRDGLRRVLDRCRDGGRGYRAEEIPALIRAGTGVDVQAVYDRWMAPQLAAN